VPVYRVRGRGRNSGDHCRPADGAEQTRPTSSSHLALPESSIRGGRCGDGSVHCITRYLHVQCNLAAGLPHGAGYAAGPALLVHDDRRGRARLQ